MMCVNQSILCKFFPISESTKEGFSLQNQVSVKKDDPYAALATFITTKIYNVCTALEKTQITFQQNTVTSI